MLISFDTLCAYVGRDKESWFANHLFHTSQDFTSLCQISLQQFRSKADESYLTLLLLIQKLLHWLFSKFSQSTSSIQRPAYFWSEMHQGLIRWLQNTVFLSVPFSVWPFLTLHLLLWLLLSQNWAVHLRTCSVLKIPFVISQNQPFIFFLCSLSFKQQFIHEKNEFGGKRTKPLRSLSCHYKQDLPYPHAAWCLQTTSGGL